MKAHLSAARWIWDDTDPATIERHHLRARRSFTLSEAQLRDLIHARGARLHITAETHYQAWINGTCLGHGPAKSPEGERFIDTHDLSRPGLLRFGVNSLEILVSALGAGTMTTTHAPAGLLFQIELPGGRIISSDSGTFVRPDPRRVHRTVRRWLLPCIEDIDAGAADDDRGWRRARLIEKQVRLLPRPVALASRQPITPVRVIAQDRVELPGLAVSFRVKPYLVDARERRRSNLYLSPALIVTDLVSPRAQTIELVPTSGEVTWYFNDRKIIASSGWGRWTGDPILLRLARGPNRLIGVHSVRDHFEEIHLAAFTPHPVSVENPFGAGGFQIVPVDPATPLPAGDTAALPPSVRAIIAAGPHPAMDPRDTLPDANPQDRVVNARVVAAKPQPGNDASNDHQAGDLLPASIHRLPAATRLVLDLGAIHNGHLAFTAFGRSGATLTFSFLESIDPGAPLRLIWPGAIGNALRYRLHDGWQTFESLHPCGVRYIVIHHETTSGDTSAPPVELHDLRIHSANCGALARATLRTGDPTLDAIHALCEQTLRAATDDTLTDCPTYETVNWNFDNRLAALADLVTFRNLPLLKNTIEQYTRDPLYPGLVRSHTPSAWENRIPVFSFHWIILCHDYHRHTADAAFADRVFPQVARGLDEALGMIDPATGLLRWRDPFDSWHLVDWAHGRDDRHDIVSAEQALLLGALEAGEYLAHASAADSRRRHALAGRWRLARQALHTAIHRRLWVPSRDAYADSLHADGTLSAVSSQPSNAALALHGAGTPAWRRRLLRRLQPGGGDTTLLPYGSPMGLFYILEFLDLHDDGEAIFKIIREKWTPMLAAGDKTAWEHFVEFGKDPENPTRSRCHPFATYILKYFPKYLLGIDSIGPGQTTILFRPRPPASIDRCEGSIPVTGGWIRVSWRRKKRGVEAAIQAPPGFTIHKAGLSLKTLI